MSAPATCTRTSNRQSSTALEFASDHSFVNSTGISIIGKPSHVQCYAKTKKCKTLSGSGSPIQLTMQCIMLCTFRPWANIEDVTIRISAKSQSPLSSPKQIGTDERTPTGDESSWSSPSVFIVAAAPSSMLHRWAPSLNQVKTAGADAHRKQTNRSTHVYAHAFDVLSGQWS